METHLLRNNYQQINQNVKSLQMTPVKYFNKQYLTDYNGNLYNNTTILNDRVLKD